MATQSSVLAWRIPGTGEPGRLPDLTGERCPWFPLETRPDSPGESRMPTLSDPMDCSLPGSSVHGIFQARVLEWGAIAFSDYHQNICYSFLPMLHPE